MKIRTDFVTNSSSSSFVIASKEELTQDKLYELLGVAEDHPLSFLLKEIVDTIFSRARKATREEIREVHRYREIPEKYAGVFAEGTEYQLYLGSFWDDTSGIEAGLCATDLNIETDEFIMIHKGGY